MDIILNYGLLLLGLIITIAADIYINCSYKKYRQVKSKSGLTGFEVAKKILKKNGLDDIHVVAIKGELTDHYDPKRKVVRLSQSVFDGDSIASVSVAAHEVGHALQDKDNYTFMKIRSALVPAVNFSSKMGYLAVFLGFIFNFLDLALVGIVLLLVILLFQLVTLPVELDASKRAKMQLAELAILDSDEVGQSSSMLMAAAFTYVASLVTTLLEILRLALVVFSHRD